MRLNFFGIIIYFININVVFFSIVMSIVPFLLGVINFRGDLFGCSVKVGRTWVGRARV